MESIKHVTEGADYIEPHIREKIENIDFEQDAGAWLAHLCPEDPTNQKFISILLECKISALD